MTPSSRFAKSFGHLQIFRLRLSLESRNNSQASFISVELGPSLCFGEVDGRVPPELLAHLQHPEFGVVRGVRRRATPPAR